jgi:hypothetical protein
VARLAGLSFEEVLALNPSHKSAFISGKGKPAVLLPADRIGAFELNLANYSSKTKGVRKRPERQNVGKAIVGLKLPEERPL